MRDESRGKEQNVLNYEPMVSSEIQDQDRQTTELTKPAASEIGRVDKWHHVLKRRLLQCEPELFKLN